LIDFFNNLSNFIITLICSEENAKERGKLIRKFVKTIVYCRQNNNFDSCQSINAALSSASVYRLQISWFYAKSKKKLFEDYEAINEILHSPAFSLLRKTIKSSNPPCIPYIGMYLTDLTFTEDGNPNYLRVDPPRDDIINFEKMRKVASSIQDIILYQQKPYNFNTVPIIQEALNRISMGEGVILECYEMSKSLESKEDIETFMENNKLDKTFRKISNFVDSTIRRKKKEKMNNENN